MARPATVTVIRAYAILTGGTEAKTHYGCDLVIEDGIVASIEDEYKGRVDIEIDPAGCLVVRGSSTATPAPGARRARGA